MLRVAGTHGPSARPRRALRRRLACESGPRPQRGARRRRPPRLVAPGWLDTAAAAQAARGRGDPAGRRADLRRTSDEAAAAAERPRLSRRRQGRSTRLSCTRPRRAACGVDLLRCETRFARLPPTCSPLPPVLRCSYSVRLAGIEVDRRRCCATRSSARSCWSASAASSSRRSDDVVLGLAPLRPRRGLRVLLAGSARLPGARPEPVVPSRSTSTRSPCCPRGRRPARRGAGDRGARPQPGAGHDRRLRCRGLADPGRESARPGRGTARGFAPSRRRNGPPASP